MSSVQETIGNTQWVINNYAHVRDVFPRQRTLMSQGGMARMGFNLRVAGVDWQSYGELAQVIVMCHHLGMYDKEVVAGQCVYITRSQLSAPPAHFFHMSDEQLAVNRLLRSEPPEEVRAQTASLLEHIRRRSLQ